jgi:hypothetical protein
MQGVEEGKVYCVWVVGLDKDKRKVAESGVVKFMVKDGEVVEK